MIRKYLYAGLMILVLSCPLFGGTDFFVSTGGSDTNPGTQAQPFATLQRAGSAVRELKKSPNLPQAGVTVWIEAGTYYVNEPLTLSNEDSGTRNAPIVYRGQSGQEVRIVGGRQVKGFQPVTDPEILNRLDVSVREKVVCADLKAAGISDYGQVAAQSNRLELFFRDEPMQLARWPNEGFLQIVDVVGETPNTTHGIKGTREGKFTYSDDRPKRWAGEQEIWLHGYWFWDWSDSFEKVSSIDTEKRVISTVPPYHNYGYRKGQRYYALNILAELDRPGEWYLDRQKGILYFLPPAPIDQGKAVLSTLRHLFVLKDCSWVTIRDLVLEATRSTAVTITGGTGNTVAGCTIRNTGSWAVNISGGSNNSVLGCDIYRTAEGGVSLSGGERKSLTPAGHRAANNHIHHFGRIYRTYRPAVSVSGVGNQVAHNVIHDGPHNAIQLGGNDHMIEFNEIHNVCFETGDVGAFYMGRDWTARGTIIRHNYFHDIKGPGLYGAMAVYLDDAASGISIIGNIFNRAGQAAFIGGGRDNLIENNIFVDCQASVHVDARGIGWMAYHVEADGTLPQRLREMPYKQPPWSEKYPRLVNILDDSPGQPSGNIVRRNISFGGKWLDVENKAMPLIKFEDNLVNKDPHFVDSDHQDFRLRPDSPAFALGFQQIPVEKIGLYRDEYRTKGIGQNKSNELRPEADVTGTFSIVAVDPETGVCGAAVASKYPAVGKVVPYARAGVGAFCTQHWHNPQWGEPALDMLAKGDLPEQILAELLRDDAQRDKRQLAIIDMSGRAANRNPARADPSGTWWGAVSGKYYACQGNTLVGQGVVFAMARAYEQTKSSLADRLMAALIAGDCAGGDHRGRLAAGIRVAKQGVDGYWLELYVDKSDDAVIDLAKQYAALDHEAKGAWRGGKLPFENPRTGRTEPPSKAEQ